MKRAVVVALLVAGCGGRGCGKHERVTAEPPPKETKTASAAVQICLDGVRALTEHTDRCEGGREWWGSVERAVAQLRPACEAMTIAPGAVYDRKQVDACVAALAKHPCGEPLPEPCRMAGTRKHGESCAFPVQCVASSFCKIPEGSLCGVCAPLAKKGEGCLEAQCEEGLTCVAGNCDKPRDAGEPCMVDYECKRTMFCHHDPTGGSAKCRRYAGDGEPCDTGQCSPSFVCEGGKCKKRTPPGKPGDACGSTLDCLDFSCAAGTCRAPGERDQRCDGPEDPPCTPSLVCHQGRCALPDALACH